MTPSLRELLGQRTLLVLAASPGDESLACGGLVAEACARGRPPLVAVLTDGASLGPPGVTEDARAAAHARETRAAVQALGLPPGRLLMSGVRDAAVPHDGWFFEQIAQALGFLTWMRDLNVLCGPRADDDRPIQAKAGAIAAATAARVGIPLVRYGSGAGAQPMVHAHGAAKARAVAAHRMLPDLTGLGAEVFAVWHGG